MPERKSTTRKESFLHVERNNQEQGGSYGVYQWLCDQPDTKVQNMDILERHKLKKEKKNKLLYRTRKKTEPKQI